MVMRHVSYGPHGRKEKKEKKNVYIYPEPRTIWVKNDPPRICPQPNGISLIVIIVLFLLKIPVVVKMVSLLTIYIEGFRLTYNDS